ncbi:hypothetical protein O6H91_06G014800 [Diphasiastrum complanatum]|nr:hypothetical protein O6H91_06G014800 [Diphasiastrum complanatum]
MKVAVVFLLALLLSTCLLASAEVYVFNNSGSDVKVSVKKGRGVAHQVVHMVGGSDHYFKLRTGASGKFTFKHTGTATVTLRDGEQVILSDQFDGPGVVGFEFSTVTGMRGAQIFGVI